MTRMGAETAGSFVGNRNRESMTKCGDGGVRCGRSPLLFQAACETDAAAARVIFAILPILPILSILSPLPFPGPVAMLTRAMRLGERNGKRQKANDKRQKTGWTGLTG